MSKNVLKYVTSCLDTSKVVKKLLYLKIFIKYQGFNLT